MYVFGIERVKSLTSDSIKAETPQRMDNIRPIPYPDFRAPYPDFRVPYPDFRVPYPDFRVWF